MFNAFPLNLHPFKIPIESPPTHGYSSQSPYPSHTHTQWNPHWNSHTQGSPVKRWQQKQLLLCALQPSADHLHSSGTCTCPLSNWYKTDILHELTEIISESEASPLDLSMLIALRDLVIIHMLHANMVQADTRATLCSQPLLQRAYATAAAWLMA